MKKTIGSVLVKTLVKPFYRQNAGQFVFIFILFFGAVGEIGGKARYTGPILQLEYQYALIQGMLSAPILFAAVLLAWWLYNEKCARFILGTLQSPDYAFLDMLNRLGAKRLYGVVLRVQLFLFLPISLYSIAVIGVACFKHWYLSGFCVTGYIGLLCCLNAARFRRQCQNPGKMLLRRSRFPQPPAYWTLFIRYAFREQKFLLTGIKLFSCGVLYFGMRTVTEDDYDLRMPVLLFSIGLFGHGVLIYKFRELEEKMLLFYRGLPVSLIRRMGGYGLLYLVLLIPEMIALVWVIPRPLHNKDAFELLFSGYSFLLLLNSLLFIAPIKIRDYLKIVFCLFLLLYFCVLAGIFVWLSVCSLVIASVLFRRQYYRYDSGELREN
jgi:hypothetical protein